MQGTYLMNGYSVFNVHVGMNPTLTYRTVLAKKRNTYFEKIKYFFALLSNIPYLQQSGRTDIQHFSIRTLVLSLREYFGLISVSNSFRHKLSTMGSVSTISEIV